ncbi:MULTISPECIES: hypothetical protein [unclassified Paenibacillus]|uniref:hypothetical protein n=1 Tax=unclassified Paenibacillus TaxID=185978 RepID=UPI0004648019|nr:MULTISPECIES: hypothetical protein [unclassified Paenibacillus]KGP85466.1 hypothetical protein P364_0100110 [Paenibacillus sp. MAEPY2]KGP87315.1 hypothetical protein P363_0113590 [Paenibacillus sp. MAEPY1]
MEEIEIEWTTSTFGYLSIPVFVVGIACYFFSDFLYKIFVLMRYRGIKPNHEFEDIPPNSDIPKHIEIILKALGTIMVILGIIWFWFSEEFYDLLFLKTATP